MKKLLKFNSFYIRSALIALLIFAFLPDSNAYPESSGQFQIVFSDVKKAPKSEFTERFSVKLLRDKVRYVKLTFKDQDDDEKYEKLKLINRFKKQQSGAITRKQTEGLIKTIETFHVKSEKKAKRYHLTEVYRDGKVEYELDDLNASAFKSTNEFGDLIGVFLDLMAITKNLDHQEIHETTQRFGKNDIQKVISINKINKLLIENYYQNAIIYLNGDGQILDCKAHYETASGLRNQLVANNSDVIQDERKMGNELILDRNLYDKDLDGSPEKVAYSLYYDVKKRSKDIKPIGVFLNNLIITKESGNNEYSSANMVNASNSKRLTSKNALKSLNKTHSFAVTEHFTDGTKAFHYKIRMSNLQIDSLNQNMVNRKIVLDGSKQAYTKPFENRLSGIKNAFRSVNNENFKKVDSFLLTEHRAWYSKSKRKGQKRIVNLPVPDNILDK